MGTQNKANSDVTSPFGTYSLPPNREARRFSVHRWGDSRFERWGISACRKQVMRGLSEPFDVTVAPGVKARLYPSTNRCEKRAFCGVQIWDAEERAALRQAVSTPMSETFVFLDVGANVGLYSLFVNAYARKQGRKARIIAVEPSAEMTARLLFNAKASGAKVEHIGVAISDVPGTAYLSDGGTNRGEGTLSESGERVEVITLLELCTRTGVSKIDALKLDIEGHDRRALNAFFRDAPESLHPGLIIVELPQEDRSAIIELLAAQNYLLEDTTSLNGIFKKSIP
jgi:FkbM family methyltransferase